MARPSVSNGQDPSLDDVKLDDLSLDDDALFADLDNEVRMDESAEGGNPVLDMKGEDLNLDFDVEAVGDTVPAKAPPAKPSNGKGAAKDAVNLDLDEAKVGSADLELDLEGPGSGDPNLDLSGPGPGGEDLNLTGPSPGGGDLDLNLDGPSPGGGDLDLNLDGPGSGGGDLDLNLGGPGPGGEDLDLNLGGPSPGGGDLDVDLGGPSPGGDLDLDLDIHDAPRAEAGSGGEDALNLDLGGSESGPTGQVEGLGGDLSLDVEDAPVEPAPRAPEELLDVDHLEMGGQGEGVGELDFRAGSDVAEPSGVPSEAADLLGQMDTFEVDLGKDAGSAESRDDVSSPGARDLDVEDRSFPKGAEQLGSIPVADEEAPRHAGDEPILDMFALPAGDRDTTASGGDFHVAPDVNLDAIDLDLDAPLPAPFTAAPDVDLNAVDLSSLDVPMAGQKGDAGTSPVDSPAITTGVADAGSWGSFTDQHQGGSEKDNLLELNLADLEPQPAGVSKPERGMAAAGTLPPPSARRDTPVSGSSLTGSILLSIPHEVQVRMGSVSLLGQDILNLNHGSVVPLNRAVGEPVDLMLDGKTIAQGEIVLINGRNLGVRIVGLNR